ncbi:ABC transporter permease [Myxococcota bacterium]|nr:ABC transporter permease [Myxococcota bacterium]MBU1382949.1 ABC transporter permease [Myxococcota bacterium]MBU1495475.1 ABC transporter permease [Myxococcota bacterium]
MKTSITDSESTKRGRGNLGLLFRMGWRNLWRQKRRSIITLAAMAAGVAICIPTYGLIAGMTKSMTDGITRMHLGDIQIHHKGYPAERKIRQTLPFDGLFDKLKKTKGIVGVAPRVYSGGMVSAEKTYKFNIIPWSGNPPPGFKLLSGKLPSVCNIVIPENYGKKIRATLGSVFMPTPFPKDTKCDSFRISGFSSGDSDAVMFVDVKYAVMFNPIDADKKPDTEKKSTPVDSDDDIDNLPKLGETPKTQGAISAKTTQKFTDNDDDIDNLPKLGENKEPKTENNIINNQSLPKIMHWNFIRSRSAPVGISAILPAEEKLVTDSWKAIIKGSYLSNDFKTTDGTPEIVIGYRLAEQLNVGLGDKIGMDSATSHFYPMDRIYRVKGIFKSGSPTIDRAIVFIHIENAWDSKLMDIKDFENPGSSARGVHEYAIHVEDPAANARYVNRINDHVPPIAMVRTWQKVDPGLAMMIQTTDVMSVIILFIILIIAAFGTMNTMLMSVMERIKEFGVLKSIGMKPFSVGLLIMIETLFLSVTASILGAIGGIAMNSWLVTNGIDLRKVLPEGYTFQGVVLDPVWRSVWETKAVLVPIVLLFVISILVALWPAFRAARIKPVEAFRQNIG